MKTFDGSAPAAPDSGIFGLPYGPEESAVHVIGVPFDATASYGKGAHRAPERVLAASRQVDLFDVDFGRPYEAGIYMEVPTSGISARIARINEQASQLADGVIAAGGRVSGDARLEADLARVNELCAEMNELVYGAVKNVLDRDALPALLGGDHSAVFGAMRACAELHPGLGILHFDAHADVRRAYEGFEWSHASILYNAMERITGVEQLVQVGLRDLSEEEYDYIQGSGGRIRALFDGTWSRAKLEGRNLRAIAEEYVALLPAAVYVSFDVDGLDPSLCPHTGTPVPGGLSWNEALLWLDVLARSGKRVIGVDVNEVNPGPPELDAGRDTIDSIVGARLLYRSIAAALVTRR